jgi:hypothetical protein
MGKELPSALGMIEMENNAYYDGQWLNGMRHGKG